MNIIVVLLTTCAVTISTVLCDVFDWMRLMKNEHSTVKNVVRRKITCSSRKVDEVQEEDGAKPLFWVDLTCWSESK